MRVLDESADIETRYGGGFVQSIDGLAGGSEDGRTVDWFFSVNGVVAELGSAEFPVAAGDTVWWDHRDWTDAMEIGAVVGAYPAPMSTGYGDEDWPVRIDCLSGPTACEVVRKQLDNAGVEAEISPGPGEPSGDVIRFVVGTADAISNDEEAGRLDLAPSGSGVFARFEQPLGSDGPLTLIGLDERGEEAERFGPDAGLVAATRRNDGPPVWIITGGTDDGVEAAASALTPDDLEHRYAAAVSAGQITSLPLP